MVGLLCITHLVKMWFHFMLHEKNLCNGKDFVPQRGGEGIKFLFLQSIYVNLSLII
jgi:hypothetical protein